MQPQRLDTSLPLRPGSMDNDRAPGGYPNVDPSLFYDEDIYAALQYADQNPGPQNDVMDTSGSDFPCPSYVESSSEQNAFQNPMYHQNSESDTSLGEQQAPSYQPYQQQESHLYQEQYQKPYQHQEFHSLHHQVQTHTPSLANQLASPDAQSPADTLPAHLYLLTHTTPTGTNPLSISPTPAIALQHADMIIRLNHPAYINKQHDAKIHVREPKILSSPTSNPTDPLSSDNITDETWIIDVEWTEHVRHYGGVPAKRGLWGRKEKRLVIDKNLGEVETVAKRRESGLVVRRVRVRRTEGEAYEGIERGVWFPGAGM